MAFVSGPQNKKNLNFELNLLPIFDILAVCICFLLMTVVWIEIRSLETKQAFGSQSTEETPKESSVWMTIDDKNNLVIEQKMASGAESKTTVPARNGSIDFERAQAALNSAAAKKISSTHILPAKFTKYDQVIKLMDLAKQAGISNIGLSPI